MSHRWVLLMFAFAALAAPLVAGGANESAPAGASESGEAAAGQAASDERGPEPADDADLIEEGIEPVRGFATDFSRSTVPGEEIISGGPPKDGIPSIDEPKFISVDEAGWLAGDEPVLVATAGGETHVYPLQVLMFHEIVNDVVGGVPVTVTFCPLCNTGIAFSREFDGRVLDFGTTGRLRYSNLVMYDRQTETWWQQATGEAIVGEYAGSQLELVPVMMLPWDTAAQSYQQARVLSRDTGLPVTYGRNPYRGYDTADRPFLYRGPDVDEAYNPMTRVVQIVANGESVAVPYPVVSRERALEREVGGVPVVVFWEAGTASALDARTVADGRDVGSANAFRAEHDGRRLTFSVEGDGFVDEQTGSTWTAVGRAIDGELAGATLEPMVGIQHFWFSYSAFETDRAWGPAE
ncbi:MAG: DUF3179 domain-containing protein [Spirochaetota bacterium]